MRYTGVLQIIAGTTLLAVIPLLFVGGPGYESTRSFAHAWDDGHIFFFALLSALLLQRPVLRRQGIARQWISVLLLTLLAGSAIELIQHYTHRDSEIGDILRDVSGSLLALAFTGRSRAVQPRALRLLLQTGALLYCLYLLLPLAQSLIDETVARMQFPVLSNLETPFERTRWGSGEDVTVTASPPPRAGSSLRIPLTTARYSGAALHYFPGDWRGYRWLYMDLYNPDSKPLQLTCRIHDLIHSQGDNAYDDRYNGEFVLHRGWNRISIDLRKVAMAPARRRMDVSHIRGIGCHASALHAPRLLYMDNIRLSKQGPAG